MKILSLYFILIIRFRICIPKSAIDLYWACWFATAWMHPIRIPRARIFWNKLLYFCIIFLCKCLCSIGLIVWKEKEPHLYDFLVDFLSSSVSYQLGWLSVFIKIICWTIWYCNFSILQPAIMRCLNPYLSTSVIHERLFLEVVHFLIYSHMFCLFNLNSIFFQNGII